MRNTSGRGGGEVVGVEGVEEGGYFADRRSACLIHRATSTTQVWIGGQQTTKHFVEKDGGR